MTTVVAGQRATVAHNSTSRPLAVARATPDYILLGLAAGLPLIFNPFGTLAFEPFKITVVRLAAAALALAYAARAWRGAEVRPTLRPAGGRPLIIAGLAYLLSTGLSSATSISPLQSLLGSYDRLQGLLTLAALMTVGFAAAQRARPIAELVDWMLIGSLPLCGYALLQHFRLDPLPWLGRALGPASTVGLSTALGGYLAMLIPLALARIVDCAARLPSTRWRGLLGQPSVQRYMTLVVVLALQIAVVLVSGVRGALIGLGVGLAVLMALMVWRAAARSSTTILLPVLGLALVVAAVGLNPGSLTDRLPAVASPPQERSSPSELRNLSGRERLLIWRDAVEAWMGSGARLLVGFGPESQAVALEPRFPLELADRLPDLRFDRVHNELLDHLLTGGAIGLAAYLGLISAAATVGWRALQRLGAAEAWLPAALLGALAAYVAQNELAFSSATTLLSFWLLLGMLVSCAGLTADGETSSGRRPLVPLAIALVGLGLLPFITSPLLADLAYTRALAFHGGKQPAGEVAWLRRAAALGPDRDLYRIALGEALNAQASQERLARRRGDALAEAEAVTRSAVDLIPAEPYNHFHLGQLLEARAEAEHREGAWAAAGDAYDRAAALSPNRALFLQAAGSALQRDGRPEEALARYRRALELHGPSAELAARIGDCLQALQRNDEALASYQAALKLTPRLGPAHAGLADLFHRQGNLARALEEARQAVRYQFREWRYRETLAKLEHEAGNSTEAVVEARAAARYAPPWEQDRLRALVAEYKGEGS